MENKELSIALEAILQCRAINPTNPMNVAKEIGNMVEALTKLPEPKSILAEAAYTGGDVPKSWIRDRGNWNDGYNQALEDVAKLREQALQKAEGK